MKKTENTYYWFFGPENYLNSGIYKYSNSFIDILQSEMCIKKKYIPFDARNLFRYIYQLIFFPISILLFYRDSKKIFSDESLLLATLFPFFPYKNSFFIIHDFRDYTYTKAHQNFFDRAYFHLLKKSFTNLKHVQNVICVSHYTKSQLIKNIHIDPLKITVIENSFDISFPNLENLDEIKESLSQKYGFPREKKILLNVGSEENRKNISTILFSMPQLPDYIFIKIGNPIITANRLKHLKLIRTHALRGIFFIDELSEHELSLFYQIADIYVTLSEFEGFGRTPIEAQIHGLPVIASNIEPFTFHLNDGAVYVSSLHDPNELARTVIDLENDRHLRRQIIENGVRNAKRFDVRANAHKFQQVLTGHLAQGQIRQHEQSI
jgi:glycosyltransferase involved in cell wall biosynthesis